MVQRISVAATQADSAAEPSGTAERVAAVIDAIVARREVGVRELAGALGISRSATHRIAQALARLRVLHTLPSGRYEPGARLLAWAASLAARDPLLAAATDVLGSLAGSTQETAYLLGYRPGDTEAIVLEVWPGTLPIRYALAVGSRLPLYAGAAGKAILAHLGDDAVNGLPQTRLTEATLTGDALTADLAAIRERGYSLSVGERLTPAAGAAAPLMRDGEVVGAAGFTIPRQRLEHANLEALGMLARDAVARIGASADRALARSRAHPTRPRPRAAVSVAGRDVARVVDTIDSLARSPAAGIDPSGLAAELSITLPTATATVERLAAARIARPDSAGRYRPDVGLLRWPGLLPDHDVVAIARELVGELVTEVDETACLLTYDADAGEAKFVLCVDCDQPIQYVVPLGSTVPLHAGASGKAILAELQRADWPGEPLPAFSDATITEVRALEREIAQVREQGYATSVGEHLVDAAGVASPFFVDGTVAGALTITMPSYRFEPARAPELATKVRRYCAELTELLSAR
jgi:DNA-binding IclR family transcriptional regulator